ncbi:hypothetical protein FOL47_001929 [Perkinsus chesapeaki]|uniref:Uncharacterized protein n=1 Tax=Perkinsus chesapeaki TaxID=330153 RepID=A0A7J6MGQ8_PERCH|nr:hypothetical protein FOL47_001929 [Perkinsus chesapeaki]
MLPYGDLVGDSLGTINKHYSTYALLKPDRNRRTVNGLKELMDRGRYRDATGLLTDKLKGTRPEYRAETGDYLQASEDCDRCTAVDDVHLKALFLNAKCFRCMGNLKKTGIMLYQIAQAADGSKGFEAICRDLPGFFTALLLEQSLPEDMELIQAVRSILGAIGRKVACRKAFTAARGLELLITVLEKAALSASSSAPGLVLSCSQLIAVVLSDPPGTHTTARNQGPARLADIVPVLLLKPAEPERAEMVESAMVLLEGICQSEELGGDMRVDEVTLGSVASLLSISRHQERATGLLLKIHSGKVDQHRLALHRAWIPHLSCFLLGGSTEMSRSQRAPRPTQQRARILLSLLPVSRASTTGDIRNTTNWLDELPDTEKALLAHHVNMVLPESYIGDGGGGGYQRALLKLAAEIVYDFTHTSDPVGDARILAKAIPPSVLGPFLLERATGCHTRADLAALLSLRRCLSHGWLQQALVSSEGSNGVSSLLRAAEKNETLRSSLLRTLGFLLLREPSPGWTDEAVDRGQHEEYTKRIQRELNDDFAVVFGQQMVAKLVAAQQRCRHDNIRAGDFQMLIRAHRLTADSLSSAADGVSKEEERFVAARRRSSGSAR